MNLENAYAIIMAGGIGSRFWPMSRTARPKQFLDILGTGKSLLQMTFERYAKFLPKENIYIVTHTRYAKQVKEQLPEVEEGQILEEPVGRNTAPCIAYASFKIQTKNPNACIIVAPSDHLILQEDDFMNDVKLAFKICDSGENIVTLGIRPTRPDTGYGYIQYLEEEESGYFRVKTFTEKPDRVMAEAFIESGDFLWNSGMFIFSINTILNAFQTHLPELYELFSQAAPQLQTPNENEAIETVYAQCKNISIDYGVMEKASQVFVIPSSFGWSDLGTWGSLYTHLDKDYFENAALSKAVIYDSNKNILMSDRKDKLIVLNGIEDCIIIDTHDALLVCKKEDEQRIRDIVSDLRNGENQKYI